MVEFLESRGIEGETVLEIGGGVGEIHIELLKRGAKRALNLELSPAYADEAERLLREAGLEERADWRLHDVAASPGVIETSDIVVMHRVVCCYPDYRRLLRSAGEHARVLIVFSYPPRNPVSRLFIGAQNLIFRLLRKEFRAFAHPPSEMLAILSERGFHQTFAHHALVWQVAGLERQLSQANHDLTSDAVR